METKLKRKIASYKRKFKITGNLKPGDLLNRSKDGIKRIVTTKKKGYKGDTDVDKKIIRIHKADHRKNKKSFHERIINTEIHETLHAQHPRATEKTVYKKANQIERKMTRKQKQKMYAKFRKKGKKC